jgi:tetratricopeptide (TPR) repeat protein
MALCPPANLCDEFIEPAGASHYDWDTGNEVTMFRKAVAITPALLLLISVAGFGQRGQQPQPPPQQSSDITIRGKLVFGNGGPDERVEVRLERSGMQLIQIQYTDSLGNFEFRGIQPAQYYIAVRVDGYDEVREEVQMSVGLGREVSVSIFMNRPAVTTVRRSGAGGDSENPDTVDVTQLSLPRKALEEYEKALQDSRKGDSDKAIKRLEEAIRIAPEFYQAHNNLGVHYQKANRFRDAEKEFRRAREINPRGQQPLVNLGSLFIQESDARKEEGQKVVGQILDNALEVLESAVKETPRSAVAHYYLGAANYKSDFYQEAETALKTALEIDPKLGSARLTLINVYIRQRQWRTVLEHLNTYLDQDPSATDRAAMERMRSQVLKALETPAP